MEKQQNIEQVKEKIAKLINKSESAKELGSLEEASVFAAKASELLLKYNLGLSDIDRNKSDYEMIRLDLKEMHGYNKTDGDWLFYMYDNIAHYNLCQAFKINVRDNTQCLVMIIGKKENYDIVIFIATQLIKALKELVKERWKEMLDAGNTLGKGQFKRVYFKGANQAIGDYLEQEKRELEKIQPELGQLIVSNGLVLKEETAKLLNGQTPRDVKSRKIDQNASQAFFLGYQDGKQIKANKALE